MELNALAVLRERTRPLHDALEGSLFTDRIMDGSLTREQFILLLQVNHHFLEAVERNAARFPELAPFIVPRAALAAEDIQDEGASLLPATTELDAWDVDRMTGALYVGLGSLLGSTVIASKLQHMPWAAELRSRFYTTGKDALQVWRTFLAHLGTVQDPAAVERLAEGAVRTFQHASDTRAKAA